MQRVCILFGELILYQVIQHHEFFLNKCLRECLLLLPELLKVCSACLFHTFPDYSDTRQSWMHCAISMVRRNINKILAQDIFSFMKKLIIDGKERKNSANHILQFKDIRMHIGLWDMVKTT